jgi:predicted phage baseplate assembly protein
MDGQSAATCDVTLTILNMSELSGTVTPTVTPVVIKTDSLSSSVRGELQAALSWNISLSETVKTIAWQHSITQTPYTTASTGKADQRILLPFGAFLDDSDTVSTPTQGAFTRVTTFFYSGPADCHCRVEVDQNNRATIVFGDGQNGAVPVGNITIGYKTGGGLTGNVEEGALKKAECSFVDSTGKTAQVVITNALAATGGFPREEVNAARVNAPESFRVMNRCVAREDFEIAAKEVPGVGRALMLTSDEDSSVEENTGHLYVIPLTGGTPSPTMLEAVYNKCTLPQPYGYPHHVTFQLTTLPPNYKTIDVAATVWLKEGYSAATVKTAIEDALEDFFSPMLADGTANTSIGFGFEYKDEDGEPVGQVAWSDVFNVVRDVAGLRKVGSDPAEFTLNGVRDDIDLANCEFPALGTVTITDGHSGVVL